jgi:hypothetical protein
MFTVKHVDDNGNEVLFNAASVRVLRKKEDHTQPGVVIEGVVGQDFNGVHYPFRNPSYPRVNSGYEAAIFVMNKSGATVANYRL